MAHPVDEVLAALRVGLEAKRTETRERVRRICEAAEVYASAVEAQLAANLAAAGGLPPPPVAIAPDVAAMVLRAEVDGLALPGPALTQVASTVAPRLEPAAVPGEEPAEESALIAEFMGLELASLPDDVFRTYAEEYAARVRHLQKRGLSNPLHAEGASRIIRSLSGMAYRRGMWDVFGLNRREEGDWLARAEEARARREQLTSEQPELASAPPVVVEAPAENDDDDSVAVPRLARATEGRPVVIVGGVKRRDELVRLRRRSGVTLEWVASHGGLHGADGLCQRIAEGAIAGVVILDGLVGPSFANAIAGSATAAGIPIVEASKPDQASLSLALEQLEDRVVGLPAAHP